MSAPSAPSFDPSRAVRFDLPRGSVRTGWPEDRMLLVPTAALCDALRAAPAAVAEAFVRAVGEGVGRRAAARMLDAQASSVEEFATQLAGEAALAGLGKLAIERWGRALVLLFEEVPLPAALLPALTASAIEAALGRKVWCMLLPAPDPSSDPARVLVTSEGAVERVRGWVDSGVPWGDAIARLHGGIR